MKKSRVIDRTRLQALKISEIRNNTTEFNLYLDVGSDIIPYTQGMHQWSDVEKQQLLSDGQFVLLYCVDDEQKVSSYLQSDADQGAPQQTIVSSDDLIADGIAEFLKTRYAYPMSKKQALTFRSLAASLQQYLQSHEDLGQVFLRLHQHDPYTFYHSARVAAFSVGISAVLDPEDPSRMWDLALGSFLHDLGNLKVETKLLHRAGPLNEREWDQIRRHPEESLVLLQSMALNPHVREIVLHHHERMDAGGYPHRLPGHELALEVRMVAMAEVFSALTQPRPYQVARDVQAALLFIESNLLAFLDQDLLRPLQIFLGEETLFQATV